MLSSSPNGLAGYMLGNTKEDQPNILRWELKKTPYTKERYNGSRRFQALSFFSRNVGKAKVTRVIQQHEENPISEFEYKGITLRINEGVCNPSVSTFSEILLEAAIDREDSFASVLDIGCGSGFYGVYVRSIGVKCVVCIDFPSIIEHARSNAVRNLGSEHGIEFRESNSIEVFKKIDRREKFDLILAKLPFSPEVSNKQFKNSLYYSAFVARDGLLFNFLLGVKLHLSVVGAAYFVFGETGDDAELRYLLGLSGLDAEIVKSFESRFSGSRHHVYRLSRSN